MEGIWLSFIRKLGLRVRNINLMSMAFILNTLVRNSIPNTGESNGYSSFFILNLPPKKIKKYKNIPMIVRRGSWGVL